jgi:F-type H+-transporting ATPase subunit gamma
MAVNTKAIKIRIQSVKNTKKITKAMEMVSASKMKKAINAALGTRMYATLASELMERLSALSEPNYSLFETRPVENVLMILVSSNRGLCGSFNTNVSKMAKSLLENTEKFAIHRTPDGETIQPKSTVTIDVLGIGKKSALFAKRHKLNLIGVFDELKENPSVEDVLPISNLALKAFREKKYDKVAIVYTHFKSSLEQIVKVRQLLPISKIDLQKMIHDLPGDEPEVVEEDTAIDCYFLEPTRDDILETVLPRLVEIQTYQSILESSASEHSARMVAMKSASEAAGEMITDLTLAFNKARQAAITQEIAEIAAGAAALE